MTFTQSAFTLTDQEFDRVREMAYGTSGLNLHQDKRALVSSRLERLVRRNGFASFNNYLNFLSQRRSGDEFVEFIDTLTTNHSGFWREPEHFVFLRNNIMPVHRSRLRIWSAACATGEEPYTIGMCALESNVSNCNIAASDISRAALNSAVQGRYDASRLSMLPTGWPERYFQTARNNGALTSRVSPAVRGLINFAPLNLLQPFSHLGIFDVIFCRNVMIYFDQETRDSLVSRLAKQLAPGGHLFTGHSETLLRLPADLQYVQPATYRKP
jgi:chemotaxis protein methyltransferase CheR